ncbi:MAG: hypothetical protein KDD40_10615, partial [Bdellovibrionales bacterium]|nr:hypothetical protein [Bdellovibrionales bacterium]
MAQYTFENVPQNVISNLKLKQPKLLSEPVSPQKADAIVKYLIQTKLFQNVAIYDVDGKYHVVGYSTKKVKDIQIVGNKNFSEEQLLEILNISTGTKFDRKKSIQSANQLKEFYGNQGFFNTKIEVSFINDGQNYLEIIFRVEEGLPCKIKDLVINSENEQLSKMIYNKLKKYKERNFSSDLVKNIENSARDYFKDKSYLRSQLNQIKVEYNEDRSYATLFYEISSPFRYELVIKEVKSFKNYSKFSQADIRRGIQLNQFEVSSLDPALEVEQKTTHLYLKKGYPHVSVRTEVKQKSDQFFKQILLYIDEGPRVKISSLNVTGRISKEESFYVNFIYDNSSELLQDGYYNRKDLELGYENLVTYLKNQGFLSAKIHSARIEFNKNKDQASIQIVMDEGPLTQIRRLKFEGIKEFDYNQLSEEIELKTNSPLRLNLLEDSIAKLKNFYRSRGYLEMKILNENDELITYNPSGT